MDTPSRNGLATVDIACSCGASLRQVDFAFRVGVAEEEFRAQHVTEFCLVSEALGLRSRLVSEITPERSDVPLFHTAAGILVEARGVPVVRNGFLKVECYRPRTNGFQGLLKVCNLTPQNDAARALAAKVRPT